MKFAMHDRLGSSWDRSNEAKPNRLRSGRLSSEIEVRSTVRWLATWLAVVSLSVAGTTCLFAAKPPKLKFRECAGDSGISFRHHSPLTPERHLHLFMGAGAAWFDYDQDGWPDLFLCQGSDWNSVTDPDDLETSCRLFRNLGDGTFADVTRSAGLLQHGYSMGAAVGDVDNDGYSDLYVTRFGPNQLYRNCGDGTFEAVAPELMDSRFGASSTFADIDNDGDLDLLWVNYLDVSRDHYPLCKREIGGVVHGAGCHPRFIRAASDCLFLNNGDGTFTDVSQVAGIQQAEPRQGLGLVAADIDDDGDLDIYVANDSVPNQLWINDGQGHFTDEALARGVAVNRIGLAEAGMGIDAGDADGDGRLDLIVTNFFNESNTYYRNDEFTFTDVTAEVGLAAPSRQRLAFGVSWIDVDNDGWLDLLLANGHIHTHLPHEPFAQQQQLFWNQQGVKFVDVSRSAGNHFIQPTVGRGTAVADFDRDGRLDAVVQQLNRPVALLRNESETANRGLQLQLIGTTSNRSAIGARVTVLAGGRQLLRPRLGSTSYLSGNEDVLLIGLGSRVIADEVRVRWPDGRTEAWPGLEVGAVHRLVEGAGRSIP